MVHTKQTAGLEIAALARENEAWNATANAVRAVSEHSEGPETPLW